MSDFVAAGCARSRFQSVSVVPISQWFFHGMTNSTDVAVRRISPASPVIFSRGTTMCTPFEARTWNRPRPPDSAWTSSVHTPVQLSTTPAPIGRLPAVLGVAHHHADDPVRLAREPDRLGGRADDGAVPGRGPRDGQRVPGVVGLGVEVAHRADQRVVAQAREHPQRGPPGQVLLPGQAGVPADRVVEREPGRHVGPLPDAVGQRVEERHRLDEVRREPGGHQFALAQRLAHQAELELLEVAQPAVEQLRRAARRPGRPSRAPRPARPTARGWPRPAPRRRRSRRRR